LQHHGQGAAQQEAEGFVPQAGALAQQIAHGAVVAQGLLDVTCGRIVRLFQAAQQVVAGTPLLMLLDQVGQGAARRDEVEAGQSGPGCNPGQHGGVLATQARAFRGPVGVDGASTFRKIQGAGPAMRRTDLDAFALQQDHFFLDLVVHRLPATQGKQMTILQHPAFQHAPDALQILPVQGRAALAAADPAASARGGDPGIGHAQGCTLSW
jgi:hypothetical protein